MERSLAFTLGLAVCVALMVPATRCGAQIVDPAATPTPDPVAARDAQVSAIYDRLRKRDVGELRRLYAAAASALPSPSPSPRAPGSPGAAAAPARSAAPELRVAPTPAPTVDPALTLALYALDPRGYRDAFVRSYPADDDAVNRDYGDRLDRARAVPGGSAFPVAALAAAAPDDPAARRALLVAASRAGGTLHDRYAAALAGVAAARPEPTLLSIAGLDTPARLAVVADSAWCLRRPALLDVRSADPLAATVRDRIADTVSRCPRPKARPRRPAPARRPGAPHGAR